MAVEFGIRIKVDGDKQAVNNINAINDATARVSNTAATATRNVAASQKSLSDATDKLTLGQAQFLEKLQQQAETAGLTRAKLLEYQAAQLGVSAQAAQYIRNIQAANDETHKFSLASAGATRELMVLGHEAATGNFSRMGGSLMVLANNAGLAQKMFSATGLTVIGLSAAALGLAVAVHQGHEEMVAMNNALAVTNNYAGLTRGGMESLAQSLTNTKQVTISTATSIVTQLVASGRIGSDAISQVAHLASDMAKATGKDIDKITPDLIKLFSDPAKGAEELNKSMHFLSVTELEHIRTLETLGKTQQAQSELAEKIKAQIPDQAKNVGTLTKALNEQVDAWTKLIQKINDWGKEQTPGQNAQALRDQLSEFKQRGVSETDPNYVAVQKALEQAEKLEDAEKRRAKAATEAAKANEEQEKSWNAVAKASQLYRVQELQKQQQLIEGFKPATPDQAADKDDAQRRLAKEIQDLYRSMGAEGRQLAQEQAAYEEQLEQIRIKGEEDQIQADLALGKINREQAAEKLNNVRLEENAAKQLYEKQILQIGGLTKTEETAHRNKLKLLQAEWDLIEQKGINDQAVKQKQAYDDVFKAIVTTGDAELKRLDDAIRAQREHNAEIGLTAEGKALVKKAIEEQTTAQLQSDAAFLQSILDEQQFDEKSRAVYEMRLKYLQDEIQKRRELSGLMGQASVLEAQRQSAEEEKKLATDVGNTLADGIVNGGENAAKRLRSIFGRLVLNPIVQPIGAAIGSAVSSLVYGGSNAMSGIGTVGSAYNFISGAGNTSLAATMANLGYANGGGAAINAGMHFSDAGFDAGYSTASQSGIGTSPVLGGNLPVIGAALAAYTMSQKYGPLGGMAAGAGSIALGGAISGAAAGTGMMAGAGAALSAIPVWGWGALAAAALLGGQGGETRSGGQYGYQFDGQTLYNNRRGTVLTGATPGVNFLEGPSGGEIDSSTVRSAIDSTVSSINSILQGVGSQAKLVGFQAGLESSSEDRGGVFAGGKLSTGATFGLSGAGDNYAGTLFDSNFTKSPDARTALANFVTDLKQTTLQALQAADDIPKTIADEIKQYDPKKLTDDQASAVLQAVSTQVTAVQQFRDALKTLPFPNMKDLSFDAAAGMLKFSNNLQALGANISNYAQEFYSEDERMQATTKDVAQQMEALGHAGVTTKEQFRALVESLDLTKESDQQLYASLMTLEPAFAAAADFAQKTADDAVAKARSSSDLQIQIMEAQGNSAGALALKRKLELDAMDASLRPLQERLYAIQDEAQQVSQARDVLQQAYERERSSLEGYQKQFQDFNKSLLQYADSLKLSDLSPLSPTQKYLEAKRQFDQTLALSKSGDQAVAAEAMSKLQSQGDEFIKLSESMNASSEVATRDFDYVQQAIEEAAAAASSQATYDQQKISLMTQQVDGILQVNQNLVSFEDALTGYLQSGGTRGASGSAGGISDPTTAGVSTSYQISNGHLVGTVGGMSGFDGVNVGNGLYWDSQRGFFQADGSHEDGLDYVPFNGYRAILHEREAVLTASEADEWRSGRAGKGMGTAIDRQASAMQSQADALHRLADAIETGQVQNRDDMRNMLQHMSVILSRKAVAA